MTVTTDDAIAFMDHAMRNWPLNGMGILTDDLEDLRAALEQRDARIRMDGAWQPIETVPKDETQILVEVRAGYFAVVSYWSDAWRETANGLALRNPPIRWMPICTTQGADHAHV